MFVHRVLSDLASKTWQLNIYAPLIGFLLGAVGIKYLLLNTFPFKQHLAVVVLFLMVITVYVIALLVLTFRSKSSNHQMNLIIMVCVCHMSGIIAIELPLFLLLVSHIWFFLIINLVLLVLLLTLVFYNYLFRPSHPNTQTAEGQATQRTDLEAPSITSTI